MAPMSDACLGTTVNNSATYILRESGERAKT